uniref:Putative plant transposon protein domain-containing protein n=1 Tax=Solanum tuberosum TaxID=4113 RepID=M1DHS2_SOLTU
MSMIRRKALPIADMLIFLGIFEPILSVSLIWLAKVIRRLADRFNESVCYYFSPTFVEMNLTLFDVFVEMARTNLDMPPRKRARGIVINERGANPPKNGRIEPPKGKGKGKRRMTKVPENNSSSEGESFDSQAAFSEPDDDQPLQSCSIGSSSSPCPYIPTWVREFYTTYGELVPKEKKKINTFRSVKSVLVWGVVVRCSRDHINVVLERGSVLDYPNLATTTTPLDDLKSCLAPLISNTTNVVTPLSVTIDALAARIVVCE